MLFRSLALSVVAFVWCSPAAAQQVAAEAMPAVPVEGAATPWVTIRFHAGPSLNLMRDWREGLGALQDRARESGLEPSDESCICMSWGTAAVAHVTPRFALGGQFEMLRDTRGFTVDDYVRLLGQTHSFGFRNETVVRTTQVLLVVYPRQGSRLHLQAGGGVGSGHTELSMPGGGATGRVHGPLFSTSIGIESRFWYADAGWRFHRMKVSDLSVYDQTIQEARDLFHSESELRGFVQDRAVDFTGIWVRIGLALHVGRR